MKMTKCEAKKKLKEKNFCTEILEEKKNDTNLRRLTMKNSISLLPPFTLP